MVDRSMYEQVERELGAGAMSSLAARNLLCDVRVAGCSAGADDDRVRGALVGLAFGDAVAEWAQRARAAGRTLGEREVREFIELHDGLPIDRRKPLGFTDPVSALSQMMVLSAEAWLGSGWRAPAALADELVRRVPTMRLPGEATRRAVERRAAGRAWYEAAGDSFGDAQLPRAVAVGLVHATEHGSLGLAASLDACVTHASQRAVAASVTLAAIVAALACQVPRSDLLVGRCDEAHRGVDAARGGALAVPRRARRPCIDRRRRPPVRRRGPRRRPAVRGELDRSDPGAHRRRRARWWRAHGARHHRRARRRRLRRLRAATAGPLRRRHRRLRGARRPHHCHATCTAVGARRRRHAETATAGGGRQPTHLVPARPIRLDGQHPHRRRRGLRAVLRFPARAVGRSRRDHRAVRHRRTPRRDRRRPPDRRGAVDPRPVPAPRHDPALRRHRRACSTAPRRPVAWRPTSSSSS